MTPPAGAYRFGNILFPGGIGAQQSHAGRLGRTIAGYPPLQGPIVGGHGRGLVPPRRNQTIVVPYAVPVYYGDPYGGYGYGQQQPVTVVVPQQPTPSVVINHNYTPENANPVMRDYSNSDLPQSGGGLQVFEGPKKQQNEPEKPAAKQEPPKQASDKPTIYLIALKDSTVRQAIGYWIENGTFNYVTPQGTISKLPLDNLDNELSQQLNAERNLEFDLNAARR